MISKKYLLDTNIVIKIWKTCPNLLRDMNRSEKVDFKIPRYIAEELSVKEFGEFNGNRVLTNRFLELLEHIIDVDIDGLSTEYSNKENSEHNYEKSSSIKYYPKKNIYMINDNKISKNDYSLIYVCQVNKDYILVTEDKSLLNSAKSIIGPSRVMNFHEFMEDVNLELDE
ncbi:PIN domain-containing protein [Clostridium sp.]|jgi:predicted nucleic acid-binding protein|uniref:PIN domain-containing protein n=1 Tax=Clostridium sp. TaxID=1506 RepID=UPI0039F5F42C